MEKNKGTALETYYLMTWGRDLGGGGGRWQVFISDDNFSRLSIRGRVGKLIGIRKRCEFIMS